MPGKGCFPLRALFGHANSKLPSVTSSSESACSTTFSKDSGCILDFDAFTQPNTTGRQSNEANRNVERTFDRTTSCFGHLVAITNRDGDSWLFAQLNAQQLEPLIRYNSIGFLFPGPNFEEHLNQILTQCKDLTADQFKLIKVKLDSLSAIYKCVNGRELEANLLLSSIENEIIGLETCDLVAWYYVARFFSSLLFLTGTKYTGRFRTYSKQHCINNLQKARKSFLGSDKVFATEAAIMLWWAFLVQTDLMDLAIDRNLFTSAEQTILRMKEVDRQYASQCINIFWRETMNLESFPQDLVHNVRQLVDLFEDHASTISEEIPAHLNKHEDNSENKEDFNILDETYYDFVEKIEGSEPECIQRIMRNKVDGKVYIYISEEYSEELHSFLEEYGATTPYFAIRKGAKVILCIKSEGRPGNTVGIIVNEQITPGAIVLRVSKQVWLSKSVPKTLNEFLTSEVIDRLGLKGKMIFWTIGGLVIDGNSGKKYVLTSAHCVDSGIVSSNDLAFLSARLTTSDANNEAMNRTLCEISTKDHFGCFGSYCKPKQRGSPNLVDVLLVEVDDSFSKSPHIDMMFKPKGVPIDLEIYTGDIDDLLNMEVSMYGCVNGECIGSGTIIDTCVDSLRINKRIYAGVFAVYLKGEEHTSEDTNAYRKRRFAAEGDSGAVVFGYSEKKKKHIAIGLVLGKNDESQNDGTGHTVSTTGESYQYVTYCTLLSIAKEYIQERFGKTIKMFDQRETIDCAQDSSDDDNGAPDPDSGYSTAMQYSTRRVERIQVTPQFSSEAEDKLSISESYTSSKPEMYELIARRNEPDTQDIIRGRFPSGSESLFTLDGTCSYVDSASEFIPIGHALSANQDIAWSPSAYDASFDTSDTELRYCLQNVHHLESPRSIRSSICSDESRPPDTLSENVSHQSLKGESVETGPIDAQKNTEQSNIQGSDCTAIVKPKTHRHGNASRLSKISCLHDLSEPERDYRIRKNQSKRKVPGLCFS